MRPTPNLAAEKFRITHGPLATSERVGNNGYFIVSTGWQHRRLEVILSDGMGWDHASVKVRQHDGTTTIPSWEDMCAIRDLFWLPDEVVMQLHPAHKDYVNVHDHVLHLWSPNDGATIPLPPTVMV